MTRQVVKRNGKRFVMIEQAASRCGWSGWPPKSRPPMTLATRTCLRFPRARRRETVRRSHLPACRLALASGRGPRRPGCQAELCGWQASGRKPFGWLESGKHSPTVRTVEKIDSCRVQPALKRARRPLRSQSAADKHPGQGIETG